MEKALLNNEGNFDINKYLKNHNLPPIEVRHKNLKRISEDSEFKSECPFCKTGLLLVSRNMNDFSLETEDGCTFCGKRVKYIDIIPNSIILKYKP